MIYSISLHGENAEFVGRTSCRSGMERLLKPLLTVFLSEATGSRPLEVPRYFSHDLIYSRAASRGYVCVLQEHKILVNITSEPESRVCSSCGLWGLLQPFLPVMALKAVGSVQRLVSRANSELIYSDVSFDAGYVVVSKEHLIYVGGRYCFVWRIPTGEKVVAASLQGLFIPFPPINSSIVSANLSALLGRLTCSGNGLWLAGPLLGGAHDWAGLDENLLRCIFSLIVGFRSLSAASYTCRSWRRVVSTLQRPCLLHPNLKSGTKELWHLVAPTSVLRNGNLQHYRLFTTPVHHTQFKLIGGSGDHLMFFNNSVCHIQNIHTGSTRTLLVPTCCGDVSYGVMSAQPESPGSYIILVSDSMLSRKDFALDGWAMRSLEHVDIGRIVDIALTGCDAYMMDSGNKLYSMSTSLDGSPVFLTGTFGVPSHGVRMGVPIAKYSRMQKLVTQRNWLLEWHEKILCIRYVQRKDMMAGFFAFCLVDDHAMDRYYKGESARFGIANLKPPCRTWEHMGGLGDCCVFLNLVPGAASFISDAPPRLGLTAGRIYIGDRDIIPWKSVDYGWVQYTTDTIMPLNAEWPSPLFMNSGVFLYFDVKLPFFNTRYTHKLLFQDIHYQKMRPSLERILTRYSLFVD